MHWHHPWALLLLLLIPFLYYKSGSQKISHSYLQIPTTSFISRSNSVRIQLYRFFPWLNYLGLLFFIIALARPQYILREEKVNAEGIDIFMVMDLSSSMLSQDFEPNRLEVSKEVAVEFIQARKYDRIGIVGFAGEGFTQCPLTVDQNILINLLNELECGILEDGTAIGMGISTAVSRLKEDTLAKSKVIILITDGVNNAGEISPGLAAQLAQTFQIKIYSIGVGTKGEAYSPIGRNYQGEYVFGMAPVNIDESLLHTISSQTGGKYYRATNREQLKEIYHEIDQLEKTKIEVRTYKRYSEQYRIFVWAGIFMIGIASFIRHFLNPMMP
ncbi:MAG: VWA domain-containing protein [Saprospiraceae bacterium]|nr:VWA domain-containing protein [Saprospiraceae bacterium]